MTCGATIENSLLFEYVRTMLDIEAAALVAQRIAKLRVKLPVGSLRNGRWMSKTAA